MRARYWFVFGGALLTIAALFFTDPDKGVSTAMMLMNLASGIVAVAAAHFALKAMFDYIDRKGLFDTASANPVGAGLIFLSLAIVLYGLLGVFAPRAHAQDLRTYIPPQAKQYLPVLANEQRAHFTETPEPAQLAALIEHESGCFSMPRKCWNPRSQLKTQREEGAGFGQITRAYRADGSERFDKLAEMRGQYQALAGWTWANVYQRPDYQLRAVALLMRENYMGLRVVSDKRERLKMADAGYNGGIGGVQSDRRACGLKYGCNPQLWTGHVATTCTKSRQPIYGGRSACDINRHHVDDVWARIDKYRVYL